MSAKGVEKAGLAGPAEGSRRATVAGAGERGRFTTRRKTEAVLRLLRGEIYAVTLREKSAGVEFVPNELDPGEDPEEAADWRAHLLRLDSMPDRVAECLASIRAEFGAMAERMLRG